MVGVTAVTTFLPRKLPANDKALAAEVMDGCVVILAWGPGSNVAATFTPEAILASLEPLRQAAEAAIAQRAEQGNVAPFPGRTGEDSSQL